MPWTGQHFQELISRALLAFFHARRRGVVKNMQFFTGKKIGATYEGKIWLYSKYCGPVQIDVSGPVTRSSEGIFITLQGEERVRNESCEEGKLVSRIWDLEYQ